MAGKLLKTDMDPKVISDITGFIAEELQDIQKYDSNNFHSTTPPGKREYHTMACPKGEVDITNDHNDALSSMPSTELIGNILCI